MGLVRIKIPNQRANLVASKVYWSKPQEEVHFLYYNLLSRNLHSRYLSTYLIAISLFCEGKKINFLDNEFVNNRLIDFIFCKVRVHYSFIHY